MSLLTSRIDGVLVTGGGESPPVTGSHYMTDETPHLSRRERRHTAEATAGESARPMPPRTGPTLIIPAKGLSRGDGAGRPWAPVGRFDPPPLSPSVPPSDATRGHPQDGGLETRSLPEGPELDGNAAVEELADDRAKRTRRELRAQRPIRRQWWHNVLEFGAILVGAALVVVLLKSLAFRAFEVPSESMSPTLITNDHIIAEMISPRFDGYKRGDVVVFRDPDDWLGDGPDDDQSPNFFQLMGLQPESTGYLVKRIIAVPGDTIIGHEDGSILINDKEFEDPYSPLTPQAPFRWTLSEGDYWMMGDNRGGSADSRMNGPANVNDFVGRVAFRFMPFDRFGPLD